MNEFDGAVNGFGPGTGPSFDTTVILNAGDSLDFAVGQGNNSSYLYDSTGLSAQVSSVKANPSEYDLTEDFSATQNPNGVWSYGWSESRGSTFRLGTPAEDTRYGHIVGWTAPFFDSPGVPIAFAVTEWEQTSAIVPAETVNFHPGPNGENSVIRWTAPVE